MQDNFKPTNGMTPLHDKFNQLFRDVISNIKDEVKVVLINITDGEDTYNDPTQKALYNFNTKTMCDNPNRLYIQFQVVPHESSAHVTAVQSTGFTPMDSQNDSTSIMRSVSQLSQRFVSQPTSQPTMVQQTSH